MFNIFKKKKKHLHAMNVNSNTRSNGEELELAVSRAFKEHYENLGEPVYVKRGLYLYTNDLSDIQQIDVLGICKKAYSSLNVRIIWEQSNFMTANIGIKQQMYPVNLMMWTGSPYSNGFIVRLSKTKDTFHLCVKYLILIIN